MEDEKVKDINALLSAFESRNEILKEEIKQNEEAIKKMQKELTFILLKRTDSALPCVVISKIIYYANVKI